MVEAPFAVPRPERFMQNPARNAILATLLLLAGGPGFAWDPGTIITSTGSPWDNRTWQGGR